MAKKKCPQCKKELHPTWSECPYCGWGTAAAGQAPTAAPTPAGNKNATMAMNAADFRPTSNNSIVGWLIPLEGNKIGELFEIKGRSTVGKAPDCEICIPESSISGRHAEFVLVQGGFRINDLGSTNGTYVNDKRINSHDLVDNDNIKLGRINCKYKVKE